MSSARSCRRTDDDAPTLPLYVLNHPREYHHDVFDHDFMTSHLVDTCAKAFKSGDVIDRFCDILTICDRDGDTNPRNIGIRIASCYDGMNEHLYGVCVDFTIDGPPFCRHIMPYNRLVVESTPPLSNIRLKPWFLASQARRDLMIISDRLLMSDSHHVYGRTDWMAVPVDDWELQIAEQEGLERLLSMGVISPICI